MYSSLQPPWAGSAAPSGLWAVLGRSSSALALLSQAVLSSVEGQPGVSVEQGLPQLRAGSLWVSQTCKGSTAPAAGGFGAVCVQTAVGVVSGAGDQFLWLFVPRKMHYLQEQSLTSHLAKGFVSR